MDLLAQCVGIWMIFVIYIAVNVEGVAFDGTCANDGDCTENNNVCTATKCACSADSFRKGGTECATTCTDSEPADQCEDVLAECRDQSGFKCLCTTSNFENKDGACAAQVALNSACTDGEPADQCLDTLAECRDESGFKCLCTTSNFENKDGACAAQVVALDDPCDSTDPAADQCAVTDAECRVNGTAKCLCKATHYVDGAACTIRIKPNFACTAGQCVIHATCDITDTNTCVCNAGYTPSPTIDPTMCNGVVKVTILTYMYMAPVLISMVFLLQ